MDYSNILIEAKTELTSQFINLLTPNIYDGFQFLYEEVAKECKKTNNNECLTQFQLSLKEIPKWSSSKVKNEYQRITNRCECDYLDDLLTGVLVSTARVLSTIGTKHKNINLKIPKIYKFIHQCYINSAREFWKFTYLFDTKIAKVEIQRNIRESEKIIEDSIRSTIRHSLPVQNILKEYLINNNDEDDIDKDITDIYKSNLKHLLQKNLETIDLQSHNDNYNMELNDSDPEINVQIESIKPLEKYLESNISVPESRQPIYDNYNESTKFDYSSDDKQSSPHKSPNKSSHHSQHHTLSDHLESKLLSNNSYHSEPLISSKINNRQLSSSHNKDVKQIILQTGKIKNDQPQIEQPKSEKNNFYNIDIIASDSDSNDSFEELNKDNTNLEALFAKI